VAALGKRVHAGQATQRSVSFGSTRPPVRLLDAEAGAQAPDCLLWDGAGFDEGNALRTETIVSREFPVVLFGSGHVATAFARVLATLPCRVRWVDQPHAQFPPPLDLSQIANITIDAHDAPDAVIDQAAPGSAFVVMTHDHACDLVLAERILRRDDFLFFGMIGSRTKRRQFEDRLAANGIDPLRIARMVCPIGVEGIVDKAPEVIALSAAAQLLQAVEAARAASTAVSDPPFSMPQPLTDHDTNTR
jgi:xanthine dehydrogenase accessory factor